MNTFYQSPGSDHHPARGTSGGTRWYVGGGAILLAAGLIGGVALAGHSGTPASQAIQAAATNPAAPAGTAGTAGPAGAPNATSPAGLADPAAAAQPGPAAQSGPAAQPGPAGQAAVLSAVLSSAGSPAGAAPAGAAQAATPGRAAHPAARRCVLAIQRLRASGRRHAARVVRRHCRRVARRWVGLRLLGGMYAQFTFRTGSGTPTIAFERGTVVSRDGSSVVVRAADGTTETWQLVSDTVVRRRGVRTSRSALAGGEPVFVAGPVVSGADEIRLAVIRPAAAATAPAGSAAGS